MKDRIFVHRIKNFKLAICDNYKSNVIRKKLEIMNAIDIRDITVIIRNCIEAVIRENVHDQLDDMIVY